MNIFYNYIISIIYIFIMIYILYDSYIEFQFVDNEFLPIIFKFDINIIKLGI